LALALALCLFVSEPRAADDDGIQGNVDAVYEEADYQTNLPGINEPLPQSTETEAPLEQEVSPDMKELVRLILLGLKWLAIIAVAAGAIYAAVMAFRAWRKRQRVPRRTDLLNARLAPDTANGEPLSVTTSFSHAERLAQQGAYGEAIHALLLAVIQALLARSDRPVPPALTGRELIALTRLNEAPRREFASLVARSEHSHFGGRPADRSAFDACHRQAVRLIDAMGSA
jgi:hypothetical protein